MAPRFRLLGGILVVAVWLAPWTAAAAPATPSAAGIVRVTGQRQVKLPASGSRFYSLSPDGRWFAVRTSTGLCVYRVTTLTKQACADVKKGGVGSVDEQGVAWSPDGTRLAFGEDATHFLVDADIWVLDVASGKLTDLTDDRFSGGIFRLIEGTPTATPIPVDIDPAWSADGRTIFFVRSTVAGGEWRGTVIERIPAAGGTPQVVAPVTIDEPLVIYFGGLHPTADGKTVYFTLGHSQMSNPANGVWAVDLGGHAPRHLLGLGDPKLGFPVLDQISADGRFGLVFATGALAFRSIGSPFSLLDLKTGAVQRLYRVGSVATPGTPRLARAVAATFSPDGSQLLYGWTENGDVKHQRLILRDLTTGAERVLLDDFWAVPQYATANGLFWATDGTVFGATVPSTGVVLRLTSGS